MPELVEDLRELWADPQKRKVLIVGGAAAIGLGVITLLRQPAPGTTSPASEVITPEEVVPADEPQSEDIMSAIEELLAAYREELAAQIEALYGDLGALGQSTSEALAQLAQQMSDALASSSYAYPAYGDYAYGDYGDFSYGYAGDEFGYFDTTTPTPTPQPGKGIVSTSESLTQAARKAAPSVLSKVLRVAQQASDDQETTSGSNALTSIIQSAQQARDSVIRSRYGEARRAVTQARSRTSISVTSPRISVPQHQLPASRYVSRVIARPPEAYNVPSAPSYTPATNAFTRAIDMLRAPSSRPAPPPPIPRPYRAPEEYIQRPPRPAPARPYRNPFDNPNV